MVDEAKRIVIRVQGSGMGGPSWWSVGRVVYVGSRYVSVR